MHAQAPRSHPWNTPAAAQGRAGLPGRRGPASRPADPHAGRSALLAFFDHAWIAGQTIFCLGAAILYWLLLRAADFLAHDVGPDDPHLQWVTVRPDTLTEGDVAEYRVHDASVSRIFKPDSTRMTEVAHSMCELATDHATWQRWRSRMPVIDDAQPAT